MKYNAEHTRGIMFRLNLKTDKDILERLDTVGNKQAYLKRLIRTDMASLAQKKDADPEQAADDSQK